MQAPYGSSLDWKVEINENELRSGKWTIEEEEYASLLISDYKNGVLYDKNGLYPHKDLKLRAWLARQLQCSSMRLSKKYVGIHKLGKVPYTSKEENMSSDSLTKIGHARLLLHNRKAFLKSVAEADALQKSMNNYKNVYKKVDGNKSNQKKTITKVKKKSRKIKKIVSKVSNISSCRRETNLGNESMKKSMEWMEWKACDLGILEFGYFVDDIPLLNSNVNTSNNVSTFLSLNSEAMELDILLSSGFSHIDKNNVPSLEEIHGSPTSLSDIFEQRTGI